MLAWSNTTLWPAKTWESSPTGRISNGFRIVKARSAEQSVVSTLYDTKKYEKVVRQDGFRMLKISLPRCSYIPPADSFSESFSPSSHHSILHSSTANMPSFYTKYSFLPTNIRYMPVAIHHEKLWFSVSKPVLVHKSPPTNRDFE